MRKFNFSSRITSVFEKMEVTYEDIKNLMFDLYHNELGEGVTRRKLKSSLETFLWKSLVLQRILLRETVREHTKSMVANSLT